MLLALHPSAALSGEQCPVCGERELWTDGGLVWCQVCHWAARVDTVCKRLKALVHQVLRAERA